MKSNETMCSEPRRASRLIPLVGIAATCSFCAIAQTFAAASFNEGLLEIQAVSHALVDAQLRYDTRAVARLLTKDFIYVGSDGSLATKDQFLPTAEDQERQPLDLLEWKLVQVRFYGDTAVGLYLIHEKSGAKGKSHEFRGHSIATWVKQNGRWVCATIHD